MTNQKLILRKEHFGGIFIDTASRETVFLDQPTYTAKKKELLKAQHQGAWVKFFDARERGYPLLTAAASSPMDIFFELTKSCNGVCTDCFMDANAPQWSAEEITFPEIEAIVRQFSDLGGFYIRLSGGEPTLRKDFFDIADLINSEGLIIGLNSNGYYGEKKLTKILAKNIKDVRISLDGPEAVNDPIRGAGTFKRITQTLKNIAAYNKSLDDPIRLTVNIVLMKSNMDYVEEMIELAQEFDAKISFGLLRVTGRAEKKEMLSPAEIVETTFRVQHARKAVGLPKGKVRINYDILCEDVVHEKFAPFPFDHSKCPIGVGGMTLNAYGEIVPCGYLVGIEDWVGEDVRGKDLMEVWRHSTVMQAARAIVRPGCQGCQYHKVNCNGGCPVMAYVFDNDIDGKDPYCVREVPVPVNG